MATVTVKLTGDLGRLRTFPQRAEAAVQAVVAEYATLIAREAQANAPVDTGALRASIHAELGRLAARVVAGGGDVDYAAFVEFGTSRMAAQPYLFPAYEMHWQAFVLAVRDAVEGAA